MMVSSYFTTKFFHFIPPPESLSCLYLCSESEDYIPMASSSQNQTVRLKSDVEPGGDMISRLPDEMLIHMLSFLPTEDAFKTCILSTRWKCLWTLVPSLDFRPKSKEPFAVGVEEPDPRFMNFIDMVLFQHSSNVKKFNISCPKEIDESRLYAWVSALLNHNKVQDIYISGFAGLHLRLPRSLFTCKTLVKLRFFCYLQIDVPAEIHFPSLKVLHVSLAYPGDDLSQRLFCSAPVLEELLIFVTRESGEAIYNISSPMLKKLLVSISPDDNENFDCVVNIDAPVLETLEVMDNCFTRYLFKRRLSLITARVKVLLPSSHDQSMENKVLVEKLIMLLKSLSTVKDLALGYRCPMAVCGSKFESKWPVFANVTRLELDISDDYDSESFKRWPQFPNLKHLHLNVDKDFASKNLSNFLAFAPNLISLVFVKKYLRKEPVHSFNSSEQGVPSCLLTSLREIEFRECDVFRKPELDVVKYLLANAQVLEKLTLRVPRIFGKIFYEQFKEAEEYKSEIVRTPRLSKQCELVFV